MKIKKKKEERFLEMHKKRNKKEEKLKIRRQEPEDFKKGVQVTHEIKEKGDILNKKHEPFLKSTNHVSKEVTKYLEKKKHKKA